MKQSRKQLELEKEKARKFLKSIEMEAKHACNQCGYRMKYVLVKNQIFVCINRACPNYGILQICALDMKRT